MSRTLAIAILTILPYYVSAQATPIVCQQGFTWSYNSLNQSPCDIAGALGGVCTNAPFTVDPLQPGFEYIGPAVTNANACQCSSVYYSILSACAACQARGYLNWSVYNANCTNRIDEQVFQGPIPSSTRVPHYAYLDVHAGDNFNITAARIAGRVADTESTAAASATATATPTPTPAKGSKSKAGPVAGGVVGGVVLLVILAGLIFLFLRRKKKQTPAYPSTYNSVGSPETATSYVKYHSFVPTSVAPAKIYDPNDPSTFPTNNPVGYSTYSGLPGPRQHVTPTFTGNTVVSPVHTQTHYTGIPEL